MALYNFPVLLDLDYSNGWILANYSTNHLISYVLIFCITKTKNRNSKILNIFIYPCFKSCIGFCKKHVGALAEKVVTSAKR